VEEMLAYNFLSGNITVTNLRVIWFSSDNLHQNCCLLLLLIHFRVSLLAFFCIFVFLSLWL
jgi:hypothetical protein